MSRFTSEDRVMIVRTDNFDRSGESPGCDEVVIATDMTPYWARIVCDFLNKRSGPNGINYFKIEPLTYKLQVFNP